MSKRRAIRDCGEEGCGECDVCKYLAFLEWAESVATDDMTIQRDADMEAYIGNFLKATK
jgi:hypothetical protein